MNLTFLLEVILIFLLILLSGFFAASEIAVIAVRKSRIRQLMEEGNPRAVFVEKLRKDPDKFFAMIQIGITVSGSAASALGGAIAVQVIKPLVEAIPNEAVKAGSESIALVLVIITISYVFLVLGELAPKALAIRFAEGIALIVGKSIYLSLVFTSLIIRFLSASTNLVLRAFGVGRRYFGESEVTEEEVKILLTEGLESGVFEKAERDLIHGVFEFTDTIVRKVMTPRPDIAAISIGASTDEILSTVTEEQYTRFPVYSENLDNIVGIIHTKDVTIMLRHSETIILEDLIREALFVPDSKKISELLRDFQRKKIHMAMVLDEFGGTAGLVTLEDVLEEIVGEIEDEYDREQKECEILPDGSALVLATMEVGDFNARFNAALDEELADTVGGYLVNTLGRVLSLNEAVEISSYSLRVVEKSGHRILKIKVVKKERRG
ncbi:MAG: hemolysin family protein [Candidatus Zixiibacteriota bacterium]